VFQRPLGGTFIAMDVGDIGTTGAVKLQLDVSTSVLRKSLDVVEQQSTALFASLSVDTPAGLTFSRSGLSPASTSRVVAYL
jgi:hypothetical protein